jgi:phosphatidate cytidylyltransferase
LIVRLGTGVALAAGIIGVLAYTPWWVLGLVVLTFFAVGSSEYLSMARKDKTPLDQLLFSGAALAVVAWPLIHDYAPAYDHGAALMLGFLVIALGQLFRPVPIEGAMHRLGVEAAGLLYIGVTFPYIFELRRLDTIHGGYVLIMVMAITFMSDTGGYFAGRFLGKHKLYEAVSPKKTMEGAVGGVTAATAAAFVCREILPGFEALSTVDCLALGVGGAIFAILGDLVESLMKRSFGVKDSGTIIPGHGGVLDRIDGLLFCGPFCFFYLQTLGPW